MMRFLIVSTALLSGLALAPAAESEKPFTSEFPVDPGDWTSSGTNPYFVLEPGYVLEFEGREDGKTVHLTITVLEETKEVAGVETRVVEERETEDGRLREVSRNYFARSKRNDSVYCFGEDVDDYEDGLVAGHGGSWHAGENGATFGLMMPGTLLLGSRYFEEHAPGTAMDRAEIVGLAETLETPAGTFEKCLKVEETSSIEKGTEWKLYAPGVGLIEDGALKLVRHGRLPK